MSQEISVQLEFRCTQSRQVVLSSISPSRKQTTSSTSQTRTPTPGRASLATSLSNMFSKPTSPATSSPDPPNVYARPNHFISCALSPQEPLAHNPQPTLKTKKEQNKKKDLPVDRNSVSNISSINPHHRPQRIRRRHPPSISLVPAQREIRLRLLRLAGIETENSRPLLDSFLVVLRAQRRVCAAVIDLEARTRTRIARVHGFDGGGPVLG